MKRLMSVRTTILALGVFSPSLALAHSGGDHIRGFLSGLEHPLLGADHLIAMLAIGVVAAQMAARVWVIVPLSFVSAMVAGSALGLEGVGLPYVDAGIALSLVVFGAMVGLAKPLPLGIAATLASVFGIFHGNAHGLEIPETAKGISYAAGFLFGTSTLRATGALSAIAVAGWPIAIRLTGIAISTLGFTLAAQTM